MNGIVTVPADLVADLRRGLRCVAGDAAYAIGEATELPADRQGRALYAERRGQLARAFALLDQIGFADPPEPGAVHIDLRAHREAVGEGLELAALVAEDELADDTPARAGAGGRLAALREYAASVAALSRRLDDDAELAREE